LLGCDQGQVHTALNGGKTLKTLQHPTSIMAAFCMKTNGVENSDSYFSSQQIYVMDKL
jgi:hypothetical protein